MPPYPLSILSIFDAADPPGLGPASRASRLGQQELESRLEAALNAVDLPPIDKTAVRATALLWHDYLEESHALSQGLHTPTGSFLHGMMHRREPDYTNAKYWFHRVGQHPAYHEISRAALPLLTRHAVPELVTQLVPNGLWDPFAFIDAVAQAEAQPEDPQRALLVTLQQIEFDSLLRSVFP
jgi:hypothetical protein